MKLIKIHKRVTEAVEDLGKLPNIKYADDYDADYSEATPVMPVSYTDAVAEASRFRKKASELIKDRRKAALDSVDAKPQDRFKNMTPKEKAFNSGEKVTLDESLFESYKLTEDEDADGVNDIELVTDVTTFKPWGGAVVNYEKLKEADKLGVLNDIVKELYPDSIDVQTFNELLKDNYDFLLAAIQGAEAGQDAE